MRFKIFGIQIEITYFFVALVSLILISDKTGVAWMPLLSAFLHEIGHLIAMKNQGYNIKKIVLSPIGASIVRKDFNASYKSDRIVCLFGPLMNFILFTATLIAYNFFQNDKLLLFALINLFMGFFNLLPIASFDGSGILKSLLCERMSIERAELLRRKLSISILFLLSIAGIMFFYKHHKNPTLMITAVYMLILEFSQLKILKNDAK